MISVDNTLESDVWGRVGGVGELLSEIIDFHRYIGQRNVWRGNGKKSRFC